MFSMNFIYLFIAVVLFHFGGAKRLNSQMPSGKPNVIIIQTDEHNFRTLGCYREQLSHDQAFIWGDGNVVETPNIDHLAHSGILFTKFYAATPLCSPSRGSLVSGMYPQYTGVPVNDAPLKDDVITFAEVLRRDSYQTAFIGKWHLDGPGKPEWAPGRKFGFADNRFTYNRGHWKKLVETEDGPHVGSTNGKGMPDYKLNGADERSFTTDFLTDRAIQFIKKNHYNPFCLYLSLPDPHGPDLVRPPYDQMYTNLHYKAPATYDVDEKRAPSWAKPQKNASIDQSQYFGMVKCIDDNIGRILDCLRDQGLIEQTMIVFTSDHGDLRAEHHRENKSVPLEASAKVAFIISYPQKIPSGSVITKAFNTVDFAPTLLSFLDQRVPKEMQGRNFSDLLLNPEHQKDWEDITFVRSSGLGDAGSWIAAMTSRYKLILSKEDDPWLIDMEKDPNELTNFINEPEKATIVKKLARQLNEYAHKRDDPFLTGTKMQADLEALL